MYIFKKIKKIISIFIFGIIFFQQIPKTIAEVPNTYIANYEISEDRDKILGLFVEIEATNKLGQNIPENKFAELHTHFQNVFPHFPKDYSFQVIYQQCLLTTESLSQQFNYSKFSMFMDNCYNPFQSIMKNIENNYTIKAEGDANPKNGPAPLTVTFNANDSKDPSNETIPTNNFFRYYRDVDGFDKIIGIGRTITHTFEKAGNYLIHLTIRSSNKENKGIFDGEKTLTINISPKSAIITIYANGKKMTKYNPLKIGVQEAEKGIIFDTSATIPIGGRQLKNYQLEINGSNNFNYIENGEGNPTIFNIIIPGKGKFNVKLTTTDNEGNSLSETYKLIISDPVAIIKNSPEEGNTSTTFSFDASTSYSVISNIRLFTREIFNENGEKIETYQGKKIKQQFNKPGTYTIKLTAEDELGKKDITTKKIYVDSTAPLAQFSISPKYDLEYPSEFILDANLSSDIDETNGYDTLTYQRDFSSPKSINIIKNGTNNKKILATFNSLGEQTITLTIKDNYGKITKISKKINIESTLRPQLIITPTATTRGTDIKFFVKSNNPIINYQRDFGDGITRTIQNNQIIHKYKKQGVYTVKLKAIGNNNIENTTKSSVFIGEKNSPIVSYIIKDENGSILTQNTSCPEISNGRTIEHPAYLVNRYQNFNIDTSNSVNIKGEKGNLSFYFQPKNDEIYKKTNLNYNFNELGCQYIDITVEDTNIGKNNKTRSRFKIVNALPTLDNIVLSYPQYGNEIGIGFQENNVKDIFNSNFSSLMVKVEANEPKDPDGFISYFKRYYYYKDDPSRILETKITPSDIPYTFFSLPRMPGEFMFGVGMYDNDGGKQKSENIIGNGPIVFFPPDVKKPDIPMVTLKVNKTTTEVGDEITFNTISKVVSDRPDFIKERIIQYDFDGDGTRDLTTKKDRVVYIYETANELGYTPRVAVTYRKYKGIGIGENIIVKKGLKPRLLFDTYGTYVIFRDISLGEIDKKQTCLSLKNCKINNNYIINKGQAFDFEYTTTGKYVVNMQIKDKHANKVSRNRILDLTGEQNTGLIYIQSIPQPQIKNNNIDFFVGNNLKNSILYNIHYTDPKNIGDCYVDIDISTDTDNDKITDNDRDFSCNELHLQKYQPKYDSTIGRIYYKINGKLQSKDFTINFLDLGIDLDPITQELYKKIQSIIISINTTQGKNKDFKNLLITLKENLIDQNNTKSNIITIQDFRNTQNIVLTNLEQNKLDEIINQLSDKTVKGAQGENEYEQAKTEILGILPNNLKIDIEQLFLEFENTTGQNTKIKISQQDARKNVLNKILATLSNKIAPEGTKQKKDQIDKIDMEAIILPNMCKIMAYYEIPSNSCSNPNLQTTQIKDIPKAKKGTSSILKTILIIIGIIIAIFIGVIIIFAIKAKKSKEDDFKEEEEEEEEKEEKKNNTTNKQ